MKKKNICNVGMQKFARNELFCCFVCQSDRYLIAYGLSNVYLGVFYWSNFENVGIYSKITGFR